MPTQVRIPSVPLVTSDPYFSLWSPADKLYEAAIVHWTGSPKPVDGQVEIDGTPYRFMGVRNCDNVAVQKDLEITATSSVYSFEAGQVSLKVTFRTPLLLDDLELVSRPCSYVDFEVCSLDGKPHVVRLSLAVDEAHVYDGAISKPVIGAGFPLKSYSVGWMGRAVQAPLSHSGDGITVDWGYFYLACPAGDEYCVEFQPQRDTERGALRATVDYKAVTGARKGFLVLAYDDILSIMYFSSARPGFWKRDGKTIYDAIESSICDHDALVSRCSAFDRYLVKRAVENAGEEYALLCTAAYRQSIAAHKLIEDENGKAVFLSKECFSNGCIGTVDVSYPSVPLYLLFNPELVLGMLRPIVKFAQLPVWDCDYAPHDVGRYPYATGQVYALRAPDGVELKTNGARMAAGEVYPPFYAYPEGVSIYDDRYQMPVEECGNMLIMEAAVLMCTGDASFSADHLELLEKWASYLLRFGSDPGDQLCTDDFGGHLAHNVNLAGKAIMGIAAFSLILKALGRDTESARYRDIARQMATDFEARALVGDHTALTFGDGYGWSLKYNLVWDGIFDTGLFSSRMIENEIQWYLRMQNPYGVPLDIRKDYTKTDWILWVAAMATKPEDRMALIRPIHRFLLDTPDRVPFTDFYFTSTARHRSMQNRTVQGGLFMPMLKEHLSAKRRK